MEIQVAEASNDILTQRLINRELDLIIANFPDKLPEIQSQVFYHEEVVLLISHSLLQKLYGGKTNAVIRSVKTERNISALTECPFLLSNQDDIAGKIGNRLIAEAAFTPKISAQSSNIETLLALCAKGNGACFCPEILARKTLAENELSTIQIFHFGNAACYPIKFGWLRQPYCWKAISNFVKIAPAMEA